MGQTAHMEVVEAVETGASVSEVVDYLADLARYPEWLDLVVRADPESGDAHAWSVEFRGRIGPLARAKRLRMVRVELDDPAVLRFERREVDGRDHSPWVLSTQVTPTASGSTVTMRLHYGGTLFGPVIERVLASEIRRARERLPAQLAAR